MKKVSGDGFSSPSSSLSPQTRLSSTVFRTADSGKKQRLFRLQWYFMVLQWWNYKQEKFTLSDMKWHEYQGILFKLNRPFSTSKFWVGCPSLASPKQPPYSSCSVLDKHPFYIHKLCNLIFNDGNNLEITFKIHLTLSRLPQFEWMCFWHHVHTTYMQHTGQPKYCIKERDMIFSFYCPDITILFLCPLSRLLSFPFFGHVDLLSAL